MASRPNIIFILADDMGYGDLACNNPGSKIPTPNLDRLAAQGMRFTDAHSATAVCTPSRYNILTGEYCWRSRLKRGIVWEWDASLIDPAKLTVAGLLKQQGYATHCIGKWHLGWDWTDTDGQPAGPQVPFGERDRDARMAMAKKIDFTARIGGGPTERGFDTYFGVDVPNFAPYTWFEQDRLAVQPTEQKPDTMYGNPGAMAPGWTLEGMIPEFTRRAAKLIETARDPFFLYFPLTSPHAPVCPNERFKGMSQAGKYGDFVCEVDWVVGEVMAALDRSGKADDTLVVFTSDNGPEPGRADYEGTYEVARIYGHYSMAHWRGAKRDIWEGGHREPYVARWPKAIPAGQVCEQLVCLGDFFATCAEITGADVPAGAGQDSVSMWPLLSGKTGHPTRKHLLYHSAKGNFAVRSNEWVFIDAPCGGENQEPDWLREKRGYTAHDFPGELFNLRADASEARNLYGERPDLVKEFSALLAEAKREGHSAKASPDDPYDMPA